MVRRHAHGVFEAEVPGVSDPARVDYRLRVHRERPVTSRATTPIATGDHATDFDLYLFGEGSSTCGLGEARARTSSRVGEATGVHFAVWAPERRSG